MARAIYTLCDSSKTKGKAVKKYALKKGLVILLNKCNSDLLHG